MKSKKATCYSKETKRESKIAEPIGAHKSIRPVAFHVISHQCPSPVRSERVIRSRGSFESS